MFYLSVTSFRVATLPRQIGTLIYLVLVGVLNVQFMTWWFLSGTWVRRFASSRMISSLRRNEIKISDLLLTKKPFVLAYCVREGDQTVVPLTFVIFFNI